MNKKASGVLKNAEINPGRICNNRCLFCMSGAERDRGRRRCWAEPKKIFSEIKRHYRNGCRSIGFLGGEPTVYPHILDSVRFATQVKPPRRSRTSSWMNSERWRFDTPNRCKKETATRSSP